MRPNLWGDLKFDFNERYFSEDEVLMLLGYLNVHVRFLSFRYWKEMTSELFRQIVYLVPNLISLKVGCFKEELNTEVIKLIVEKVPNIKELDVRLMFFLKDEHLKILQSLTKINSIGISSYYFSRDAFLSLFKQFHNLKLIDFGFRGTSFNIE
jgi:hypothetical protein